MCSVKDVPMRCSGRWRRAGKAGLFWEGLSAEGACEDIRGEGTVHNGSTSNRRRGPRLGLVFGRTCRAFHVPSPLCPWTQGTGSSSMGWHNFLQGVSGVRPAGHAPLLLLIMGQWARRGDFRVEQGPWPPGGCPPSAWTGQRGSSEGTAHREAAGGRAEARGRGWGWGRPTWLTEPRACSL